MMARNPDIIFITEYIKKVLYFATVRHGKDLKSTSDIHYFCIDNELVYENYYSDFGPLNLGCVYRYCKMMNDKLKVYAHKQHIVHYTSVDPKKKANAAFLLGCFGVLYLNLLPKEALKPLQCGQNYRPFQDATQGDSNYTISLLDCLNAIKKANDLGLFNFQDFNYEEYERLDKIQGGDLNWIVPGKFLAFIGPVDYSVSLYHPPEMYIDYFLENDVKIVIRLNKRLYDGNVFNNVGIKHYDMYFPDGSCPPKNILFEFLRTSEEWDCAIAVHCKAGLGRTGSLIGCYLIKHYQMSAREAIGWMRICRPGSVIGQQQGWLEQLESWLIKQGNLYRKRMNQDPDKLPFHEFGIYSIAEKSQKQRPVLFRKTVSPPPPIQRSIRPEVLPVVRPQASKVREDENEEVFLASCDLTTQPMAPSSNIKGCIIKNNSTMDESDDNDLDDHASQRKISFWEKIFCCRPFISICDSCIWMSAVRCAKFAPSTCCCSFLDTVAPGKPAEQSSWRVKSPKISGSHKNQSKGDENGSALRSTNCTVGAGEPRAPRSSSSSRTPISQGKKSWNNPNETKKISGSTVGPPNRSIQSPIIKTVNDARNYLMRSSMYNEEREKYLNSIIKVTPHYSYRTGNVNEYITNREHNNVYKMSPSSFTTDSKGPTQPSHRRRLGRSPSPPQIRVLTEQSRATNTPSSPKDFLARDASKCALKEALSRLKYLTWQASCKIITICTTRADLTPPEMGALVTKALRPVKTFNIENRAHRVISKEKPTPAPKYPSNIEDLKRVAEVEPDLDVKLDKKDPELDLRLRDIYVTSHGRPEDDITREQQRSNPDRPLPQNRHIVEDFDFGFKEPDKVPYGRTTIRHAINFISAHQINPEEVTASKIAMEYKLKQEDVENILKYFKTYEVYLPETKSAPATFAGPSLLRRQLYKMDAKQIGEEKDGEKNIDELLEKMKSNKSS